MKLWEVESYLQEVTGYTEPKIKLEQYETPSHIAAHLLFTAETSFGDLKGKNVADLGCGCGMLTVGASMFEPSAVTGFDIDEDALAICQTNLKDFELEDVELKQLDLLEATEMSPYLSQFDTVVLNPPFGTKNNQGTDLAFLKVASTLSSNVVYSLHKTSTRAHVLKKAKEFALEGKVIAELKYDLPKTYKFHKKASVDVKVDFIRFTKIK